MKYNAWHTDLSYTSNCWSQLLQNATATAFCFCTAHAVGDCKYSIWRTEMVMGKLPTDGVVSLSSLFFSRIFYFWLLFSICNTVAAIESFPAAVDICGSSQTVAVIERRWNCEWDPEPDPNPQRSNHSFSSINTQSDRRGATYSTVSHRGLRFSRAAMQTLHGDQNTWNRKLCFGLWLNMYII